jgi:hypothetical protein
VGLNPPTADKYFTSGLTARPNAPKSAASLKQQRDLSNFLIVVAYCRAVALIGFAQPYMYKAYKKCDCWHYAGKQPKLKQQ